MIEVKDWSPGVYREGDGRLEVFDPKQGGWQRIGGRNADPLGIAYDYHRQVAWSYLPPPGEEVHLSRVRAVVVLPRWREGDARGLLRAVTQLDPKDAARIGVMGESVFRDPGRLATGGKTLTPAGGIPQDWVDRLRGRLGEAEARADGRRPLEISGQAREVVKNPRGVSYRRVRGPAGSGKSVALAARAGELASPPSGPRNRSPFNHHITPGPDQLLRVVVATAFRRGRLKSVYQVLRGKNPDTGERSPELREENFGRLASAQARVLNLHNWHEYLRAIDAAGFRSAKQISSEFALLACYALWLVGRDRGLPARALQNIVARWFFMSQATGRYSSSPETKLDRDLRLADESDGPAGFAAALEDALKLEMGEDYFSLRVPSELDARSWRNRPLAAYEAALVVLGAPVLFSPTNETVASRLDPSIVAVRGIERHHLFPKAWLRREHSVSGHALNGLADRPANASWVDWIENGEISDQPPHEYFDQHARRLTEDQLEEQMKYHALPDGWHQMDYASFLDKRRMLMAEVIRDGYGKLRSRMPEVG